MEIPAKIPTLINSGRTMKRKNRRNKTSTMGDALDAVKSKQKKLEASTLPADDMELYQSILGKDAKLPEVLIAGDDVQDDREDSTSTALSHSLSIKYNNSRLSNETRGRIKAKTVKSNREKDEMKRGTSGWEDTLRQRPKKTELFQVSPGPQRKLPVEDGNNSKTGKTNQVEDGNNSRTGKTNQVNGEENKSKCEGSRIPNLEKKDGHIDPTEESNDPDFGHVVWGKLGRQNWWPGIVVEGYMVLKQQAQPSTSWIFWFGDHKISQIPRDKILPFIVNFSRLFAGKQTGSLFKRGVTEAIKVCAEKCGCSNLDDQQLTDWAVKGFMKDELNIHEDCYITTDQKNPIPDFVMEMISDFRSLMQKHCEDSTSDDRDTTDRGDALDAVKSKQKKLEDICICCNDLKQEVVDQHPLFVGGLCIECKKDIIETFFAVGNDGTGMFCAVCSSGGKMFVCEDTECNNVFCLECVKLFLGEEHIEKIEQANPWLCFMCSPYLTETHGYLIPKLDYRQNVLKMFDSGYRVQDKDLNYLLRGEKKKIRVLSLFDGIGTGKVVLDKLGLDVEVYYTSEIDEDSLLVTTYHHGDTVTPLGDVTKLTETKLKEISPIDLLIGGSPCNDLSLANPLRKGFTDLGSSAMLFLDYYRVLTCLQKFSNNRHVFWLYENVASMKKEYKDVISRFLQCEPALWDAKYFSAQSRPRYFWGNIPGMYSTPDLSDIKSTSDLDDILSQKCNRKATVKILRTVTTRQNSLKQGKNDAIFPVTMNGKDDIIWVSELERVFGFPDHYTDVGNLPVTRRRQMIGKAWSVPVVRNILNILTEFFAGVKPTEKENI